MQHGLVCQSRFPSEEPEAGVGLEGQATEGGGDEDNTARTGFFS